MNILQKIIMDCFGVNKKFPDGSYVTPLHRMALKYVDGDKSVDIGYDHIPWSNRYEIIPDSIQCWNHPFESETISADEKEAIIKKVIEYSKSRKHIYSIK